MEIIGNLTLEGGGRQSSWSSVPSVYQLKLSQRKFGKEN